MGKAFLTPTELESIEEAKKDLMKCLPEKALTPRRISSEPRLAHDPKVSTLKLDIQVQSKKTSLPSPRRTATASGSGNTSGAGSRGPSPAGSGSGNALGSVGDESDRKRKPELFDIHGIGSRTPQPHRPAERQEVNWHMTS